jgi:hypothetical protein
LQVSDIHLEEIGLHLIKQIVRLSFKDEFIDDN